MPVTVLIPTPLRPFTNHRASVTAEGRDVRELLNDLTATHTALRPHLFTPDGALRSFVNVYVNDENIRFLRREDTPVGAADTLSIVPSVAGGSSVAETAEAELPALTHDEIKQ